jgi:hypothetical protein
MLTINGIQHKLGPIMSTYMELCTYGAIWGGLIGGTIGFTTVAATPIVILALGLSKVANSLSSKV